MKETIDIERIYDTHASRLYRISLRIVGDENDAEEVMHDTLLKLYEFRKKNEILDLAGWLSSVCVRKSIDKVRQKYRYKDFLSRYASEDLDDEDSPWTDQEYSVEDIRNALASLPDHYRLVLTLHLFEGYDYQEISQITGSKETCIRTLYMRGRQRIAKQLKEQKNG